MGRAGPHRGDQSIVQLRAPERHRVAVVGGGHRQGRAHEPGAEDRDARHQPMALTASYRAGREASIAA